MKLLHHIAILLVAIALSSNVSGQDVTMKGVITERKSEIKLSNCLITILRNGQEFKTLNTGASSNYEFSLELGFDYYITWSKDGYLSMSAALDTRNIPDEDKQGGFEIELPCALFKSVEGFNLSLLKEPIVKFSYDPKTGYINLDEAYSKSFLKKMEEEIKRATSAKSQQHIY